MKRGFTLIEMIFVVVISAILSLGAFKAMEALYLRSARAKAVTELSLRSQVALDQLAALLYQRIPNSAIGYLKDGTTATCKALEEIDGEYRILEWLAMDESNLTAGRYDGFVDLQESGRDTLKASDLNKSAMGDSSAFNLIFAGSFDAGDETLEACEGAFGWHGHDSNLSFDISISSDDNITITDSVEPDFIYEKYYLTRGAYAVARGDDVDVGQCSDLPFDPADLNLKTTLFLFYGYRPWAGKTFCGDKMESDASKREGHVTILAEEVAGFWADTVNGAIRLRLDMNRTIRGGNGGGKVVHITKQKVVF